MKAPSLVLALVLALLFDATAALAQDAEADARAHLHYQAGEDLFRHGDYEGALREFGMSYEMSQRPELLYNLGATHERLGHYAEAADHFERYLASASSPTDASALTERARRLRERGTRDASSPTETEVGAEMAPSELLTEEPDAGAASASGSGPHPVGWVVLGVGAAGLATFGVLGGLALAEDGTLASECGTACSPARASTLDALSVGADVALGLGAAVAAVGIVLLIAVPADGPSAPPEGASARLHLGPTGVVLDGQF